jgi:pimeloyl-ACP methyl ester carboxylesterase
VLNIGRDYAGWVPEWTVKTGLRHLPELLDVSPGQLDTISVLQDRPVPALFIAAGDDKVAPQSEVQRLQEAASNPRVSGLYEMRRSNGHVVFRRKLTDSLKLEYPRFAEVLPEQVTIDATHMHQQGNRVRFEDEPELLRQHVLVDVPEEY